MITGNTIKNTNEQSAEQKMTTIMLFIINKALDMKSVKKYFDSQKTANQEEKNEKE